MPRHRTHARTGVRAFAVHVQSIRVCAGKSSNRLDAGRESVAATRVYVDRGGMDGRGR
jgi:hypothetical protein